MLNRPQTHAHAAPASSQAAATFGLLGAVFGVLIAGRRALAQQPEPHGARAGRGNPRPWGSRRECADDVDAAGAQGGALDALLHDIRIGGSTDSFLRLYTRASTELDAAREQLAALEADKGAEPRLPRAGRRAEGGQRRAFRRPPEGGDAGEGGRGGDGRLREYQTELDEQGLIVQRANDGASAGGYSTASYVAAGAIVGCVLLALGPGLVADPRRPARDPGRRSTLAPRPPTHPRDEPHRRNP